MSVFDILSARNSTVLRVQLDKKAQAFNLSTTLVRHAWPCHLRMSHSLKLTIDG